MSKPRPLQEAVPEPVAERTDILVAYHMPEPARSEQLRVPILLRALLWR
jgi:hypothetical protein